MIDGAGERDIHYRAEVRSMGVEDAPALPICHLMLHEHRAGGWTGVLDLRPRVDTEPEESENEDWSTTCNVVERKPCIAGALYTRQRRAVHNTRSPEDPEGFKLIQFPNSHVPSLVMETAVIGFLPR